MGVIGPRSSRNNRVDVARRLVEQQREVVATTKIGSPAHRQASDVLALIEESHFLLSELDRLSSPSSAAEPAKQQWSRRRLRTLQVVSVFAAALVAATMFLEIADPAPMRLLAGELALEAAQPPIP